MIFTNKMKTMKIYRKPLFLPTLDDDKKKKSAILLLTPNFESSKRLIESPLTINRLRYQSYYFDYSPVYTVDKNKVVEDDILEESYVYGNTYDDLYHNLNEMSALEKKKLNPSDYGLPDKKKYPMPDAKHVRSAIRFFNYVDESDEKELAKNIIAKIKEFNLGDIKVGNKNRFAKYFNKIDLSEYCYDITGHIVAESTINSPDDPVISVSAIIELPNGKILVLDHNKANALNLPGGKVNEGETNEEAIKRELKEELGIEIGDFELCTVSDFLCNYPEGSDEYVYFKDYTYKVFNYTGTIENREPEKHRDILWMDRDDLFKEKSVAKSCLLRKYLDYWRNKANDITDALYYSLSDYIKFNGYDKDVEIASKLITPLLYFNILKNILQLPLHNQLDIPVLNLHINDEEDVFTIDEERGKIIIDLSVDITNSIDDIVVDLAYAILLTKYPQVENTILPKIYLAYTLDLDNVYKDYGIYLFEEYGLSIPEFYEACETGAIDNITNALGEKFGLRRNDIIEEASAPITIENLNQKFKYATSTKIKRMNSMRGLKATKRLENNIKDQLTVKMNLPTVAAPSGNSSSSGNDDGGSEGDDSASGSLEIKESAFIRDFLEEDYIALGNNIIVFNEDANGVQLRRLLYPERVYKRSVILDKCKAAIEAMPTIKYAYPELKRYGKKNVFVDLYYYNEVFFRNNTWKLKKGFDLYLDLMERLIKNKQLDANGYEKKTLFIPVLDWNLTKSMRMWMYREGINPISILFELMRTNSTKIKAIFKNMDIIFFGADKYFKINFNEVDELPKLAVKFRLFITKLITGQEFDSEDMDIPAEAKESPDAIKANIIDKIETAKGVDLTGKEKRLKADNEVKLKNSSVTPSKPVAIKPVKPAKVEKVPDKEEDDDEVISKGTNAEEIDTKEKELEHIAFNIDNIANTASSTDDALDSIDSDDAADLKISIANIDSLKPDSVKVEPTRAARINKLNDEFLNKSIKGKSIRDILEDKGTVKKLETTELKVSSPNKEWKEMKYMNFNKDYDLNRHVLACLRHFQTTSYPIAIRNIEIEDTSTSEDSILTYKMECEDSRGKRFSFRLDIPKIKDNRFTLRGNVKSIQTQFCNMPILKTNFDAAQIISNYQKIFVYRVNNNTGRSTPVSSKIIKTLNKMKDNKDVKISYGDNSKICAKYELPIDYIDLASVYNTIETDNFIVYFNQDEIKEKYPTMIDYAVGMPYAYNKKSNSIMYYNATASNFARFSDIVNDNILIFIPGYMDIYNTVTASTSGAYTRCNMMSSKIPMIIVLGYMEGLTKVLKKANIHWRIEEKLTKEIRHNDGWDYVEFSDGYLVYDVSYHASLLLNGFKECSTEAFSITDIDNKAMYFEMLDDFGGRIKADGIDNFYDCLIDPITKEVLELYNMPTDVVEVFLYANNLLADNKFVRHTDTSSRRARRAEMVAAYTYEALSEAYGSYANQIRHNRTGAEFNIKQTSVIDKMLASPISSDDSIINALCSVETTNAVTYKGKAGLNSDRSYSIDKRIYDDSMLNVLGLSTGFSGNVGLTRQLTMDANIEGSLGLVKTIDGDTNKLNTAKALTATEAMTPFSVTRDDSARIAMTFVQTAKHAVRTVESDPLLVTSGADEAMPYITTDKFAFKAKSDGKVSELTNDYMVVTYNDGSTDFINLKETVEKNSDGGFYVPLKLDANNLRVGSKFKANEILAYDKLSFSNSVGESDTLAYNVGKLAKVAIINTDEGYEDSGVCNESLSDKLATKIIIKADHKIAKDANVFKMVKVGDVVNIDDALIIWQDPFEEEDANIVLKSLAGDKDEISELGRRSVRSTVAGVVKDIKIYRTVEIEELSESLQKIVRNYEKDIIALKKRLKSYNIDTSELPATYKLSATGKLKNAQDVVLIEFYVEYLDRISVGDKITYFSANKAVEKNIIPRELAPYTDFRPNEPVDAFVSEFSIDKRIVSSIPIYGALQKLMVELDRSCKDLAGIKYDDSTV